MIEKWGKAILRGENLEYGHFCTFCHKTRHLRRTYATQEPTSSYNYWSGGYVCFENHNNFPFIFSYFGGSGLKKGKNSQKSTIFSHFGRDYRINTNFPNDNGYASIESVSSANQSEIQLNIVGTVFEKNTKNFSKMGKCHFCPFCLKIRGKCYPWRLYSTQQPMCWYIYWRGRYVGFEKQKKFSHVFFYFVGSGLENGKNRPFLSHFGRDYRKNTNFPNYRAYTSIEPDSSPKQSENLIKFVGSVFEKN